MIRCFNEFMNGVAVKFIIQIELKGRMKSRLNKTMQKNNKKHEEGESFLQTMKK